MTPIDSLRSRLSRSDLALACWSTIAAFGAYFCMYGFRKPFTAAAFADDSWWGLSEKVVLVTSQVLGYMLAKFLGIKIVAEINPARRAFGILLALGSAELALLCFGITRGPLAYLSFFANGLALGFVFGLVLGYLEGRRHTEALTAGLCASFILADGVTKSIGTWLLQNGVTERWMPFAAGVLFIPPLLVFVWMLTQIPPPSPADELLRSARAPMFASDRRSFFFRYQGGLLGLLFFYLFITILRTLRADFAPELWRALGTPIIPGLFTRSELLIALAVLAFNGLSILVKDNQRAFFNALGLSLAGIALAAVALLGLSLNLLGGFTFMVLLGLGLYLPYVAIHTTFFERLIAMTRERGNIGYFMYLADSIAYLGYVCVMLGKGLLRPDTNFLRFYSFAAWIGLGLSTLFLLLAWNRFASYRTAARVPAPASLPAVP